MQWMATRYSLRSPGATQERSVNPGVMRAGAQYNPIDGGCDEFCQRADAVASAAGRMGGSEVSPILGT